MGCHAKRVCKRTRACSSAPSPALEPGALATAAPRGRPPQRPPGSGTWRSARRWRPRRRPAPWPAQSASAGRAAPGLLGGGREGGARGGAVSRQLQPGAAAGRPALHRAAACRGQGWRGRAHVLPAAQAVAATVPWFPAQPRERPQARTRSAHKRAAVAASGGQRAALAQQVVEHRALADRALGVVDLVCTTEEERRGWVGWQAASGLAVRMPCGLAGGLVCRRSRQAAQRGPSRPVAHPHPMLAHRPSLCGGELHAAHP